jgi:muramoyltetrapeptide carboxypeptidase
VSGSYRPPAPPTNNHLLTTTRPLTLHRNTNLMSASVESAGRAKGYLMGGNLTALAGMVGAGLPDLTGAILLLEAERQIGLGQIDRQLTQLINSGALNDIRVRIERCSRQPATRNARWRA